MNEEYKKEFMNEFKQVDGSKRLEMWDYILSQQVIWENILFEVSKIARKQGVDKELNKMMD